MHPQSWRLLTVNYIAVQRIFSSFFFKLTIIFFNNVKTADHEVSIDGDSSSSKRGRGGTPSLNQRVLREAVRIKSVKVVSYLREKLPFWSELLASENKHRAEKLRCTLRELISGCCCGS